MTVNDLITTVNTFIGDSSEDRISQNDRFTAISEATSWLLEELGNEHMTDRAYIEYLPTITWYKMDNVTPYLLTAGQLRYKNEETWQGDFTRIDARELSTKVHNRNAFAIERYNGDSYLGIIVPSEEENSRELFSMSESDGLTYSGINAVNIIPEKEHIRFDMEATGLTSTGLYTTTQAISLEDYEDIGFLIFELEIPDISDITSVSLKFGSNLTTDYWLGSVTQDVNGNELAEGVNILKIAWRDLTTIGSPDVSSITEWSWSINHAITKAVAEGFKISSFTIAEAIDLTFKYIFYRVGKNASLVDITEFSDETDVPFFSDRYPQYKFAVAHKAAGILYRTLQLFENASMEDTEARQALKRYRKNFTGERDQGSSTFKVAGISFRRKIIKRN